MYVYLLFCELRQYPAILTEYFKFCHHYFNDFKHNPNKLSPTSSNKRTPLNKVLVRIFKEMRRVPLFYSVEKKVMGGIRLFLVLGGRLYASSECLECKMQKSS